MNKQLLRITQNAQSTRFVLHPTNEPDRLDDSTLNMNLDFGVDWITVVFDDEYL